MAGLVVVDGLSIRQVPRGGSQKRLDLHVRKEFPTGHRCSAIEFCKLAGVRNGEAGDSINTGVVFKTSNNQSHHPHNS